MKALFDKVRPLFEGEDAKLGWAWPLFDAAETFAYTPHHATKEKVHVRDPMDVKRLMIFVLYAMLPAILMGWYNVGRQGFIAEGNADFTIVDAMLRGGWHMLPIIITSYAAGGAAEVAFAIYRKHEISEGFLVTAMLFPMTLAPTTPLWIVAAGVIFGVVIGKEVFGGVGMNVLNPALTARAFVFFAMPAFISGDKVWNVGGLPWFGHDATPVVDGISGATPLLRVASAPAGDNALAALSDWSFADLALGAIPGSMGEVSAVAALIGATILVVTRIASWRIILSTVLGVAAMATVFNLFAGPESSALMHLPAHYHLVTGGFAFGAVFMATDPVSAAHTDKGRWVYGFLIGVICVLIRVVNPAYPEGMMLAILFMNVFAPLIDYGVVHRSTKKRAKRLAGA